MQSLLGNRNEVELTRKRIDVWETKLFIDSKKSRESALKKFKDEQNGRQEEDGNEYN